MTAHDPEPPILEGAPVPPGWEPHGPVNGRDLPGGDYDPIAESQVLAAAMTSPVALAELTPHVQADHFYLPANETIWDTVADLAAAGEPVDAVIVADRLGPKALRRVGGVTYLHDLIRGLVSAANATYYAGIIRQHALRRALRRTAVRLNQMMDEQADPVLALTVAEGEVGQLRRLAADDAPTLSTWQPVDIAGLDLDHVQEPVLLERGDGHCLLYAGSVHTVTGEPESGKSWVAQLAIAQQLKAGLPALYCDFEDRPGRVVRRLLDMGVPRANINELFRYVRPDVALTADLIPHLEAAAHDCTICILDGITEAMTMHGLSLNDNEDIARFLALLPRRIADLGPAVLQVDHVVKDAEARGRYAIGGQHKLAGIDGAQYKVIVTEPFGKGKRGHANILVDKDREGGVRQHTVGIKMAELIIDSTPTTDGSEAGDVGPLRIYLDAPDTSAIADDGTFTPTERMKAVSDYVGLVPGCSQRDILANVDGKDTITKAAVKALVAQGYMRQAAGKGKGYAYFSDRPYTDDGVPPW